MFENENHNIDKTTFGDGMDIAQYWKFFVISEGRIDGFCTKNL